MAQELAERGRFGLVFRGDDGLDELTTTTTSTVWMVTPEGVQQQSLDPKDFGIKTVSQDALLGGDAQQNAQTARDLFAGKTEKQLGAVRDIVILNAAGGVVAYQAAKNPQLSGSSLKSQFESAIQMVSSALDSGAAGAKLEQWVSATQK
jgi:anthranilate phosphoribosyltransferase